MVSTHLKNICHSNWKSSPNRGENKKYLKPPPSSSNFIVGKFTMSLTRITGTASKLSTNEWGWTGRIFEQLKTFSTQWSIKIHIYIYIYQQMYHQWLFINISTYTVSNKTACCECTQTPVPVWPPHINPKKLWHCHPGTCPSAEMIEVTIKAKPVLSRAPDFFKKVRS